RLLEHNYELNPLVAQIALCFYKFSEKMLEDIRFYTCSTEGIGATLQYNLLKSKYSDKYIDKKDVLEQLNNITNDIVPKTIYSDVDSAM
ncbi:34264_t:CDS:2, partial [Gigaspora margarita]